MLAAAVLLPQCSSDNIGGGSSSGDVTTSVAVSTSTGTGMLPTGVIRVSQLGYTFSGPKRAYLMSADVWTDARFGFAVSGQQMPIQKLGPDLGPVNDKFRHVYPIDFDWLNTPATDNIIVQAFGMVTSPTITVGPGSVLGENLVQDALAFYYVQRDGMAAKTPIHLDDMAASVFDPPAYDVMPDGSYVLKGTLSAIGGPVDVEGGWADAGDYIKLVETTSYAVIAMIIASRSVIGQFLEQEYGVGIDWLSKMWDDKSATLYYQVGIGDGNANILGDHDVWRLPEDDAALSVSPGDPKYYLRYRPVFRAGPPGSPVSPNLAGRLAAAFALDAQQKVASSPALAEDALARAEHIYALADTSPGELLTASPHDYYPEVEWRDDMELGAAEIARALSIVHAWPVPNTDPRFYVKEAAHWAKAYIGGPNAGADTLNLYDVSALAHAELAGAAAGDFSGLEVNQDDLAADLKSQLEIGVARAAKDPFGMGVDLADGDAAPHALGLSVTARLYAELTQKDDYRTFGTRQRDWVLGANPWGESFVGLPALDAIEPRCLHHQVANIGMTMPLIGAVVAGPVTPASIGDLGDYLPDEKGCSVGLTDFDSPGASFVDDVRSSSTVEPALDYAALTFLVAGQLVKEN